MIEEIRLIIAIILGAFSTGLPLYLQIRKMNLRFKADENKITSKERINSEAEWKRIIEFRDAELVRLRERDDQQERQLNDLWDKHIQCQRNEAAQAERIRANEERAKANEDQIKVLNEKILELMKLLIPQKAQS